MSKMSYGDGERADQDRATLYAENNELRTLLADYVRAYPAFTSAPVGAPHSPARIEQEMKASMEQRAKALLGTSQEKEP